jgi:hypothetical protein
MLGGLATTRSNVYQSRAYALSPSSELPCLLIYTLGEDTSKLVLCHPGEQDRSISVAIEGIAAATEDLDDTLDQIAKEVEVKMATDFYLSNLAKNVQLTRTEIQFQAGDSPQPVGSVRMTWIVLTTTREGAPDVVV